MTSANGHLELTEKLLALRVRAGAPRISMAALMLAVVVVLNSNTNARAQASGGLDQSVVVVNSRGIFSGSIETFAKNSKKNSKPQALDVFSGGNGSTVLEAASGVAVSPVAHLNYVASRQPFGVLGFSPTANGANILPEIEILPTITGGLETTPLDPAGVAFDSMAHPTLDTTGQIYVANFDSDGNVCGFNGGSISVYDADANRSAPPNLIVEDCTTPLFSPVGLFVDEATVDLCLGSAPDAADLCNPVGGNVIIPLQTRRIWVVNRTDFLTTATGTLFLGGYVTVYTPDFAELLDKMGLSSFCVPEPNNTLTPTQLCVEPPLGGFFYTTTNNGPPCVRGDVCPPGDDSTTPDYLAVNTSETTAYLTDISGGFRGRGRVKMFALHGNPVCLEQVSGNCTVAATPFLSGMDTGKDKEITGARTRINLPMGISVATVAAGDELFVTNVNSDSLVEFGPGAVGNAAPVAVVEGRGSGMRQPTGNAITPPPLIP